MWHHFTVRSARIQRTAAHALGADSNSFLLATDQNGTLVCSSGSTVGVIRQTVASSLERPRCDGESTKGAPVSRLGSDSGAPVRRCVPRAYGSPARAGAAGSSATACAHDRTERAGGGVVLGVREGSWGAPGGSAIVAARRVTEPASADNPGGKGDNPGGKGDNPGPGSSLSWISAHPFIHE